METRNAPAWGAAGFTVMLDTLNAVLQLCAMAGLFCACAAVAKTRRYPKNAAAIVSRGGEITSKLGKLKFNLTFKLELPSWSA